MKMPRPSTKTQIGSAVVEVALVVSAFMLLMRATLDLANYLHTRSKIQHAVSQATRLAITGNKLPSPDKDTAPLSREASIEQVVRHYTGLNLNSGQVRIYTVAPNGSLMAGPGGPGDVVLVRVDYDVPIFTPGLRHLFPNGRAHIRCSTRFRNEQFSVSSLPVTTIRPLTDALS